MYIYSLLEISLSKYTWTAEKMNAKGNVELFKNSGTFVLNVQIS